MSAVAVLFARPDSVYKQIELADVWDIHRDARNYRGNAPVVAHPPCRAWGRLRHMANPRHDERDLAHFAVSAVRSFGGVLEHPAGSTLWAEAGLALPGTRDAHGGFTMPIRQHWFGHRADKNTWLYVVGCSRATFPRFRLFWAALPPSLNRSDAPPANIRPMSWPPGFVTLRGAASDPTSNDPGQSRRA